MKFFIPTLLICAALGMLGGFTIAASPVPADLAAPVSASPVEADDAPDPVAAPIDAGPATGIGTSPIVVIPDPIEDPGAFGGVALDAARTGKLALLAILVLLCLSRGAVAAADRWPAKLGWLGGKARPWIVASAGALATLATSVATLGRVDLSAVAGAVALAIGLELRAAPAKRVAPESLGGGK